VYLGACPCDGAGTLDLDLPRKRSYKIEHGNTPLIGRACGIERSSVLHARGATSIAKPQSEIFMPTLYLTCGLPGSGKTSLAKIIEHEASALRLTGDDWMHKLYPGISTPEAETGPCRSRVESLQWQIALRAIRLQCNVVVDWGCGRGQSATPAGKKLARMVPTSSSASATFHLRSFGTASLGETPSYPPGLSTSRERTCLGGQRCLSRQAPRRWRFMICQTTRPSPPFYDTPQRQARLGCKAGCADQSSSRERRQLSHLWQLSGSRAHATKVRNGEGVAKVTSAQR
jgi:hypothetical protein